MLVRHGETTGESRIRLNGRTDVPLSAVGQAQMRRAGEALRGERFDRVLCTPLTRARQSAALVRPGQDAEVVGDLIEVDFGNWERLTVEEAAQRDPELYARQSMPDFRYPGGESRAGFRARVAAAVQEHFATLEGRCLAVLHKGTIRAALGALLGPEGFTTPCDLGSIHRLARREGRWVALSLSDVAHLAPDLHLPD